MIPRADAMERLYEMLSDAGVDIGAQQKRESLASDLAAQGMTPEQLDRLIGHASVQKCDDWRALLYSWLREEARWRELDKDLDRTEGAMSKRKKAKPEPGLSERNTFKPMVTDDERIFYRWFYDRESPEEIAKDTTHTPSAVALMAERQARVNGVTEEAIARRKAK